MPQVDVIMPVWRGLDWVGLTLESLSAQTFTDWRLVVVDDNCPDSTGLLALELQPRATLVRLETNRGAAAARAEGVAVSEAPLLALLDQDDLWHPTKLERQVEALRERPLAGAAHTDAIIIDESGVSKGPAATNERRQLDWDAASTTDILRAQFQANRVLVNSALVRREAWLDVGGQPDPYGGEDWGLWVRLLGRGWHLAHLPEGLLYYRRHQKNTSSDPRRAVGMNQTRRRLAIRYAHRLGVRATLQYIRTPRS